MKKAALIGVAVLAVAIVAVFSYRYYQGRQAEGRVLALVRQGIQDLRSALARQTAVASTSEAEVYATAAEKRASALREMNTASITQLADAADDMLVTMREVLRRQVTIERSRSALGHSLEQLMQHMRVDRGKDWTTDAVRMKNAVDKDLRDYRIAVESYAALLESFPESQKRIAPFMRSEPLIDPDVLQAARERALDAYTNTAQNVKRATAIGSRRSDSGPSRTTAIRETA
jgi:hypothetical protein